MSATLVVMISHGDKHASESITKRQTFWRDHVLAAAAHEGSIVEYAKVHSLKTKDIYQWKTALTKRGLLPVDTSCFVFHN